MLSYEDTEVPVSCCFHTLHVSEFIGIQIREPEFIRVQGRVIAEMTKAHYI